MDNTIVEKRPIWADPLFCVKTWAVVMIHAARHTIVPDYHAAIRALFYPIIYIYQ